MMRKISKLDLCVGIVAVGITVAAALLAYNHRSVKAYNNPDNNFTAAQALKDNMIRISSSSIGSIPANLVSCSWDPAQYCGCRLADGKIKYIPKTERKK